MAGEHLWPDTPSTVDPLHWNIHLEGGSCVLELESGTVPNYSSSKAYYAPPWSGYTDGAWHPRDDISQIRVSGHVKVLSAHALFAGLSMVASADVGNLDFSDLQDGNMADAFAFDTALSTVNGIEHWDTSKATSLAGIFNGDTSFASLDLGSWKMAQVTDFDCIFGGLGQTLTKIKLGSGQSLPAAAFHKQYDNDNATVVNDESWQNVQWKSGTTPEWDGVPFVDGLTAGSEDTWFKNDAMMPTPTPLYTTCYAVFNANNGSGSAPPRQSGICGWFDSASGGSWQYFTIRFPPLNTMYRTNYQALGWSTNPSATNKQYSPGDTLRTLQQNTTFYVVWQYAPPKTLPTSTDVKLLPPTNDTPDSVTVTGLLTSGSNYFPLASGDVEDVWLMPPGTTSTSTSESVGTQASSSTLIISTNKWSAQFPVSALNAYDQTGKGTTPTFRVRLRTGGHGNSGFAFFTFKADLVAPAVDGLTFNPSTRTVSGTVYSSGDAVAQSNRDKESGDKVTIIWPTGSSPTTLSTTTTNGNGAFSVVAPPGTAFGGSAQISVQDLPATADTVTLTGTGTTAPNVSQQVSLPLTMPTVSSLPMTGASMSSQALHYFLPLTGAAFTALAVVGIEVLRRRRIFNPKGYPDRANR
ncbi:BspA family leucine-rich repeat surface protein [Bifidobacterium sp. ESL0745]|uniref:BspA family leucine-rich repeat surface protein n=1 Tax=Bifidobacterium sp. ESL0745 TaxID=2983226 RepID=UPI0023F72380|nr:BspA family leucine-rich repeat surface protein [Bifidobacterium sp. ESL0745]MDF7664555.1 BspA family leucine-rich repeat surface protein [Bifidobacterium sp. ESL0745]